MAKRTATSGPGPVALHALDVHFDWSETPVHWLRDDPVASHVWNAVSIMLPEGERWFCATFREALPLIEDDRLRETVRGFIGQEAVHAESHQSVITEVLAQHGIDSEPVVRRVADLCRAALGPRGAPAAVRHRHLVTRLALTAAVENLTAVAGDWILDARLEDFGADETMLDLFRWHGAEEVEHRMVAHDVAEYFGVGYVQRVVMLVLAYVGFFTLLTRTSLFLARRDPALQNHSTVVLVGKAFGSMRRGSLPSLGHLVWSGLRALNPRFTPVVMGDTARAVAYLATSPAARAANG